MEDYTVNKNDFELLVEAEQSRLKADVAKQYIEARKKKKMTQEEVANVSGIKRPNITRFEKGDYNPTIDMLVKVAKSMNMKVEIRLKK